jgi:flagellar hook-associated protein 1 FlgK
VSLDSALSIASGGLANINLQFGVISQNVANAATPGYAREIATQQNVTADGVGMGVRSGPATRNVDDVLQGDLLHGNAAVAGLQTQQTALQAIDTAQGTPGQGNDLPSLLGGLQDAFSKLAADPSNETQQAGVVSAAGTLANAINQISGVYTEQRQGAQDGIATDLDTLNSTLATVGQLSDQIIALKAAGQSTADLENQRDAALQSASSLTDLRVLNQPNGDVMVLTPSGLQLPIHSANQTLSTQNASIGPNAYYPGGGIPGIMLGGVDVTNQLTGGTIGADIALRDKTLPTDQAELDEFAQNLASRFDAQGLRLFSNVAGAVPASTGSPVQSGYVGFASEIQVNPAVQAQPSLVRDGTQAVAGSATGASAFTPNPSGGPAGFSTLISRVLNYALGSDVQSGVQQPASATSGLGPSGTLSAPYAAPATLADMASSLVGAQGQESASVTQRLTSEQGVQTALQTKISAQSGVNMDTEMSAMITLQNAYGANAKIIAAVQTMWTQTLAMVN